MNERMNLPSASGFERLALCPGSWQLERDLPEATNPDAEAGTRIHMALAGALTGECEWSKFLLEDDSDLAARCLEMLADLRKTMDFMQAVQRVEQRLWCPNSRGEAAWSGKADLVLVNEVRKRAMVVDWKTGRNEVQPAGGNLQLRALAVLVWENYGVSEVTVAIIQPWAGGGGVANICTYTEADLERAAAEMDGIVAAAMDPRAPRTAGPEQCKYCRATAVCAEYQAWVTTDLPALAKPLLPVRDWSPDDWAFFLRRVSEAEKWLDERKQEAKRLLEDDPAAIPGFRLAYSTRRSISNAPEVYQRAAELGVTAQEFAAACKVSITAVKDLVRNATKKKGKELQVEVDGCLEGCVVEKPVVTVEEV